MSLFEIPTSLISTLRAAKRVVAMTGAGTSAESGVPTFRDAQTGLWAQYEPTELATPQAFERNPKLVWDWYAWRKSKVDAVEPNAGHLALVAMERQVPHLSLITQNVDGLHQQAGSRNVIELHGSILRAKCFSENHLAETWPDDQLQQPPLCQTCGSLMRPDVVWFHESLPTQAIEEAIRVTGECDVFLSIGTSSVVHPAAALAESAVQNGATVVEINPNSTPLTPHATYSIAGPSGHVLPALVDTLHNA